MVLLRAKEEAAIELTVTTCNAGFFLVIRDILAANPVIAAIHVSVQAMDLILAGASYNTKTTECGFAMFRWPSVVALAVQPGGWPFPAKWDFDRKEFELAVRACR